MRLTKKYLREFFDARGMAMPASLEKDLLKDYAHAVIDDDGQVFEYTEQDIYEQLRKRVHEASSFPPGASPPCE